MLLVGLFFFFFFSCEFSWVGGGPVGGILISLFKSLFLSGFWDLARLGSIFYYYLLYCWGHQLSRFLCLMFVQGVVFFGVDWRRGNKGGGNLISFFQCCALGKRPVVMVCLMGPEAFGSGDSCNFWGVALFFF